MPPMEVDPDLLDRARRGKRSAIIELLQLYYPQVWRVAVALTGREDVGRGVTLYVMRRSLQHIERWQDQEAPTRWFRHHTLMTLRRTRKHKPDLFNDVLIRRSDRNDPAYTAFIKALRDLPEQQREAFLLTHGEKLPPRQIAIAMDCSMHAAQMHLSEAEKHLRLLGQGDYESLVQHLHDRHQRLTPDEQMILPSLRRQLRRSIWWRRIRVLSKAALWLVILGGIGYAGWWTWPVVSPRLQEFLTPTTAPSTVPVEGEPEHHP